MLLAKQLNYQTVPLQTSHFGRLVKRSLCKNLRPRPFAIETQNRRDDEQL
jgi:hypothetical protein